MQNNEMQLAEILSDLVSLRPGVCPPTAALALVSARPTSSPSSSTAPPTTTPNAPTDETTPSDPDLARAKQLVALHYDVRERCKSGELGQGLQEARWAVERAVGR